MACGVNMGFLEPSTRVSCCWRLPEALAKRSFKTHHQASSSLESIKDIKGLVSYKPCIPITTLAGQPVLSTGPGVRQQTFHACFARDLKERHWETSKSANKNQRHVVVGPTRMILPCPLGLRKLEGLPCGSKTDRVRICINLHTLSLKS